MKKRQALQALVEDISSNKSGLKYLAYAALLLNMLFLLHYILIGYQNIFHSDTAAQIILAEHMLKTGQFFVQDWHYVNKDYWSIYAHLWIVPFLVLLPDLMHAFMASRLCMAALILGISFLLIRKMIAAPKMQILCLAILAGGISNLFIEQFFGQAAYGTWFLWGAILLLLLFPFLKSPEKTRLPFSLALILLQALIFWQNPERGLVSYWFPLAALLLAYIWQAPEQKKPAFMAFIYLLIGCVIGAGLHKITGQNLLTNAHYPSLAWVGVDQFLPNLGNFLAGYMGGLDALPPATSKVKDAELPQIMLRLFSALCFLPLMFISGKTLYARADKTAWLIWIFAIASLALQLFFATFTNAYSMHNDPVQVSRYAIPSLLFGLLALVAAAEDWRWRNAPIAKMAAMLSLGGLLLGGLFNFLHTQPYKPDHHALIAKIEALGLEEGFMDFWDAGRIYVLSNGRINARHYLLEDGVPSPYRWLTKESSLAAEKPDAPSFLVINRGQEQQLNWKNIHVKTGASFTARLEVGEYILFVLPRYLWDLPPAQPAR